MFVAVFVLPFLLRLLQNQKISLSFFVFENTHTIFTTTGTVKLWDGRLGLLKCFDMSEARPSARSLSVRSVCYDPRRELILVGMRGSELYEFTRETKACRQLLQGHTGSAECEVWGMAPHPTNPDILAKRETTKPYASGTQKNTVSFELRNWGVHRVPSVGHKTGPCWRWG